VPIERPTFSESWYRVAALRPRLRSTVQVHRQHFRGQMWHVLQDPSSNQFFRLNEGGYQFVALLEGRRTVAEVWRICNDQLGDAAPTQGEAIQLLGQLYTSNLLQAELQPDAEGLFNRYRKRKTREVQGYLMNLLFIRIPILDPDRFLNRWVGLFGRAFSWYGLLFWTALVATGLYFVAGHVGELADRASGVLNPENLPLLYLSFFFVKVFHEFGHAFAVKTFGQRSGSGGEVHVMGIMFLVFTPVGYVDASSAWALRRKWHRIIVGAAGMLVEIAIAAIAAVVWVNTAEGLTIHAVAYNVMFIASVSTVLFNANPLLRYDGYYMLSDLLEIPNLAQRSKDYIYYLVRKYIWNVRLARTTVQTGGEKRWMIFYAIASTVYRVFICVAILLFIADKLFILGAILAITAVIAWVCVPLVKFARYLATNGELDRVRGRAAMSTACALLILLGCIGLIPAPDRCRVEGVVEPENLAVIHMRTDGVVSRALSSVTKVQPGGEPILAAANDDLQTQKDQLGFDRNRLEKLKSLAQTRDTAEAQIYSEGLSAIDEQIARVEEQVAALQIKAPFEGTWVPADTQEKKGAYIHRGDRLGVVADLDHVVVRATAGQDVAALLITEADKRVEMRLKDRPDIQVSGRILKIMPAGLEELPSAALGYAAGGSVQTSQQDRLGTKAAERFFEIRIAPSNDSSTRLLAGQRIVVRFDMPSKPLIVQWWRALLQLIQRRFHT
jgi:putative peptide zinc metalloprotease protein